MEEEKPPSVSFVPCVKWIRKGVAKYQPIKVELSKDELKQVIMGAKKSLSIGDEDDEGDSEADATEDSQNQGNGSQDDEYNMAAYDDEEDEAARANIGDVAVYDEELVEEAPDSDDENDVIKPEDHLLAVGHVEDDASVLEIYVYNEEEGSMYVHHDIPLASIPLALEWLNYDPENVNRAGNMMAVGMMSPIIEVWDLDIINALEPGFKLGRKGNRAKGRSRVGHTDAVLDLSWNTNYTHVLASGSVDKKVLLWDLESQHPTQTLDQFSMEVQTLEWHPTEGQTLLTGDKSGACKIFDCRSESTCKTWTMPGAVERVLWNRQNPSQFVSSDDKGNVWCCDCRQDNPLVTFQAHSKGVSGMTMSSQIPGLLLTGSEDQTMKVWDLLEPQPVLVATLPLRIGDVHCVGCAPDNPLLYAAGGNKAKLNLKVANLNTNEAVRARFGGREMLQSLPIEGSSEPQPSSSSGSPTFLRKGSIEKKKKKSPLLVRKKKKTLKKGK